jgi:hypothetical protein
MIARDNRVVSIGFEGVEKRERGLGVEVTHAELRDGAFHPLSWDAEPELPGVSIGEDRMPTRPRASRQMLTEKGGEMVGELVIGCHRLASAIKAPYGRSTSHLTGNTSSSIARGKTPISS